MILSEAIVVKIAHDLAGGIGAISSSTDLMELDPSFISEAPALLKKNSQMLISRLKFYRALFGAENKSIDTSLILDFLQTFANTITFSGKITNRLELAFVAVGIQIIAGGGDLLYANKTLILKTDNLTIPEKINHILTNPNISSYTPDTIETEWLMYLLQQANLKLKITHNPSFLKLEIV